MTARELLSSMAFALATGETPKSADWYPDPRSFEAAVEAVEVEKLADVERMIRASCFMHNPDAETGWITCHCEVADELARQRRAAPQPEPIKERQ